MQRFNQLHRLTQRLELIMLKLIHLLPLPTAFARPALSLRFASSLMRFWRAQCRCAERPDRFVPYY